MSSAISLFTFFTPPPLRPQTLTLIPSTRKTKPPPTLALSTPQTLTTFLHAPDPLLPPSFNPPLPPANYTPPPAFDDLPPEPEEAITAAYEAIYGPAYSGESALGNDVYVMDAKAKKAGSGLGRRKREKAGDGFEERVVQVRRVTKVVKGGKKMSFRAVVVVGNRKGEVGVGVGKAKEVVDAIAKSATNARRNVVCVPMTKYSTFPHR